jgi:menaquinone-dependent protoporphyrinogen IX oxidase
MNGKKTLIAYASKSGVTEENAKIISDILISNYGHEVNLINLNENSKPNISQYDNVIIGSGIRIARWYGKANKFLKNDFTGKKVAIFLSSGYAGKPETYQEAITKYIDKKLAKNPHINPVAAEAFGGRYKDVEDYTDPEKVKAWAIELGKKLSI